MERWRKIFGYYEVSDFGNIRSNCNGKTRLLKKQVSNKGYYTIMLFKDGEPKGYKVPRLVALAFPEICGQWFEGATINHKNEDKTDNRAENLEWLSVGDNVRYGTGILRSRWKTGLSKNKVTLVFDYKTGELLKKCDSRGEAAEYTGVNYGNITSIIKGIRKQSKGFYFREGV